MRARHRHRHGAVLPATGPANLDTLPLGAEGVVMAITGERRFRRRLMEMGLLEGSRLRVVKFAPTGDPIQIQVNDYFLSLRRMEASRIIVMRKAVEVEDVTSGK
jgi:Fe2+ transport system protein FeoA